MAMIHPDDRDFSKTEPVTIAQVRSRRRAIQTALSIPPDIYLISNASRHVGGRSTRLRTVEHTGTISQALLHIFAGLVDCFSRQRMGGKERGPPDCKVRLPLRSLERSLISGQAVHRECQGPARSRMHRSCPTSRHRSSPDSVLLGVHSGARQLVGIRVYLHGTYVAGPGNYYETSS
jgi:hypothetical protein